MVHVVHFSSMETNSRTMLLEPDERGRISLARVPGELAERYLARRLEDGTVILEPVVVLPVRAVESLTRAMESHGKRRRGEASTTPLAQVLKKKR